MKNIVLFMAVGIASAQQINLRQLQQDGATDGQSINWSALLGRWNPSSANNLPFAVSSNYIFSQSPSGTLTAGTPATVTLAPVPSGVNGTDAYHYLYLGTCSGGAQAILITGGTAVAGASSGTLTFTPTNSCTAGWTIGTATAGIQEAIQQNCASYLGCGILVPSGVWTTYAPITFFSSSSFLNSGITLFGMGQSSQLERGTTFTTGNMVWMGSPVAANPGAFYTIQDLFFLTPYTVNVTSGAAIYVTGNSGQDIIEDVTIWNGYRGVTIDAATASLHNVHYLQQAQAVSNLIAANAGLYLTSAGAAGPSGVFVSDSSFLTQNTGSTSYSLSYGIFIQAADGVQIINSAATGQDGVILATNGVSDLNDVYMDNMVIDGVASFGFATLGLTPAGRFVGNFRLTNSHVYTYSSSASSQNAIDIGGLGGSPTNVVLANNNIGGFQLYGIRVGGSATYVKITGNQIMNNLAAGISLPSGSAAIDIEGNTFGNLSGATPIQPVGIIIGQTFNFSNVSGNNFAGVVTALNLLTPGSVSGTTFDSNTAIGIPAVASAASLQLPLAPTFTLTGTTGVTSVNIPWILGTRFSFVATTASPGSWSAGSTILNTFTPTQNVPVSCIVLSGSQISCRP